MITRKTTRRTFNSTIGGIAGGAVLTVGMRTLKAQKLTARAGQATASTPAGLHKLGLRSERDALLYIPSSAAEHESAPLVVSLHGASRNADRGIELLRSLADQHGFLLLAPASEGQTWDAIQRGEWGSDAGFINQSLSRAFELRRVDSRRIAMAGFSDGASASLSIGLSNGDVFSAVFGFSPGFISPAARSGKPPVFISHGTEDQVLPIDECSRRIVPQLKQEGYRVTYREFPGKHTLPPEVAAEAMRWFLEAPRI